MNIYFINEEHKKNLLAIAEKFPKVEVAADVRSASYLMALPEIFKCFSLKAQVNGPFDWYVDYLQNGFVRRELAGSPAGLTGQTRPLVDLALNLYNGHVKIDMGSLVTSLDYELYLATLQAIDLCRSRASIDFTKLQTVR